MAKLDFTKMYWGHNLEILSNDQKGNLEAFVWHTPIPKKGDEIVYKTNYGTAVGVVDSSEWQMNVDDMYLLKFHIIYRVVEGKRIDA